MRSRTTANFRKAFAQLPIEVQKQAKQAFRAWKSDLRHPSLHFKRVHQSLPVYSVRIGINWRAVGTQSSDGMIWFWIGSHNDYNNLLSRWR
jgi:hypothetical protein